MARILIVEDEPDIALGLVDDLTREGYQVETAATGPEGLKRARGEAWELILLDVMLPGMDGFDVCRELRRARIRTIQPSSRYGARTSATRPPASPTSSSS